MSEEQDEPQCDKRHALHAILISWYVDPGMRVALLMNVISEILALETKPDTDTSYRQILHEMADKLLENVINLSNQVEKMKARAVEAVVQHLKEQEKPKPSQN
jgi:hypothetical protein